MHAGVTGQLRMERGDEEATVAAAAPARRRDSASTSTSAPDLGDTRRADEDAAERLGLAVELEVGFEARELAAVAVPLDLDVDEPEMRAVEQDHPRAGAEARER